MSTGAEPPTDPHSTRAGAGVPHFGAAPPTGSPQPPTGGAWPPMLIAGVVALAIAVVVLVVVLVGGDDETDDRADVETADELVDGEPVATAEPADESIDEPTEETAEPTPTPQAVVAPEASPPTVDELASAVVQIQLLLGDQPVCSGSGTIVDTDGTVLTNSHVIAQTRFCPHDRIAVAITDVPDLPPLLLFEADLLVDDPALDLAVIRIARTLDGTPVTQDFPTVAIGDSDTLVLGDQLRVIGYPGIGGETITFTEGTISGFVSVPGLGDRSWLKTDATISGGNSGGLAVDESGAIVGIPTIVGTGDGQITDCRVVEDTNGDGRIDQDDSCVPVGGFINGIRPVNLAVPLIERAAGAAPIDQGGPEVPEPMPAQRPLAFDAVWTLGVDANGFAARAVTVVPANPAELCLTWNYDNVAQGAPFEVIWTVDGVPDPGFGATGTNQGDVAGSFFACAANQGAGLAAGTYEVVWVVEDEPVFTHSVYVGGNRDEIEIEVINDTDTPLCVVQFAPSDTLSFGVNRIDAPVPPGASVVVRFASGRYDARVIDCDGALRFEDPEGTRLASSTTLTIV
jgi:S1-C subfamily serine protease